MNGKKRKIVGGEESHGKMEARNITCLLMILNCFCGGDYKVFRRQTLCLTDQVYQIVDYKCKLCGQMAYGDLQPKENDWEGLK